MSKIDVPAAAVCAVNPCSRNPPGCRSPPRDGEVVFDVDIQDIDAAHCASGDTDQVTPATAPERSNASFVADGIKVSAAAPCLGNCGQLLWHTARKHAPAGVFGQTDGHVAHLETTWLYP